MDCLTTFCENTQYINNGIRCAVCLENITEQDEPISCGHTFHSSCLKKWRDKCNTCPLCRQVIDRDRPSKKCRYSSIEEDQELAISFGREISGIDFFQKPKTIHLRHLNI